MQRINANSLENMLLAIEAVTEKADVEFQAEMEELRNSGKGIPKVLFNEFIKAARVLVTPRRNTLGRFVVITGVDKSGKETQAFNLEHKPDIISLFDYLSERSYNVLKVSLPSYQTTFGSLIASYLGKIDSEITITGNLSSDAAWILWSLDRAQHHQRLENWLENSPKNVVLSKRWTETNIAYQQPLGISEKRVLHFERNLAKPHFTIVLDVPTEQIFIRMEASGEIPDRYETPEFLSKVAYVYKNLERLYHIGKILHVDGSGSVSEVNARLIKILANIISNWSLKTVSERFC